MLKHFYRSTIAIALLTNNAHAAPWIVDTSRSTLTFIGTQAGDPFKGEFKKFSPVIDFDQKHPEQGKIEVTIDMASASIDDKDKQASLPTNDWFATAKFPTAKFVSTKISHEGLDSNTYHVDGNLTIRGITKPIWFMFTLEESGKSAKAFGLVSLNRNDFGVGQGKEWETDKWIAFPVKVEFTILASK